MQCSALLLAGGKSSRMGRDKSLLKFEGQPLWRRQLETLRALSPQQLMLAGPARPGCDCEVIADEMPEAGPLGGLAAGLRHCRAPRLVALAVDLPQISADFLRSLLAACDDYRGMVLRVAGQSFDAYGLRLCKGAGYYEPLAAVYPARCAALASAALREGDFSMQAFVERALEQGYLRERELTAAELQLFTNINTPAEYEESRQRAIHQSR
jgi:molybdopterin-guanine dinucleotide biosynthesis protein A